MHNETYEQKRRRLFGKVNFLPAYLQQLNKLLNIEVTKNSAVETTGLECQLYDGTNQCKRMWITAYP